ncbi:transcription antiterminator [Listeria booriae]|uniref:BglG family transcription antiterminator n=1 Tax=Listeria booriae TaxID=1552123 RepID=UPI00162AC76D|nr:BglG family transcription antiterminator [Listeria booriae]MBC1648604.1 transcription antiterminator [Listeria booriae]
MKLNQQSMEILEFLLAQESFVNMNVIATELVISDRVVRYNLNKLDVFLEERGLEKTMRHRRKGVMLARKQEVQPVVAMFKQRITPERYRYSQEEIQRFLLLRLLLCDEATPVTYFEQVLFISRTSVLNHLKAIEGELFLNDLELIHKPRIGFYLEGSIVLKCSLFARRFIQTVSVHEFYRFLDSGDCSSKKGELFFNNLFDFDLLERIVMEIEEIEDGIDRAMDDQLYLMLLVAFVKQHAQKEDWSYADFRKGNSVDMLDNTMEIILNTVRQYRVGEQDEAQITSFVVALCERVGRQYRMDFMDGDRAFFRQLRAHILWMVRRIESGVMIENPIFHAFIRDNRAVFQVVRECCESLGKQINPQEISFLAIYFASEMERRKHLLMEKPKLLVVCPEGVAVSNMLAMQLKQYFELEEIETVSLRKMTPDLIRKFDFVVSTIDLPELDSSRVLRVNGYLQEDDLELLQDHLQMRLKKTEQEAVGKFSQILDIVSRNAEITNFSKLEFELLEALISDGWERPRVPQIVFRKDMVVRVRRANTWQQAIEIGAKRLEEVGVTTADFRRKVIANIKCYGPYMVVAPGVVLAHAGPEDGILQDGLGVTVIEEGILFFDRFDEPVRVIFTLALRTKEAPILVEQLMKLIVNQDKMAKFKAGHSTDDVYHDVLSAIYE